MIGSYHADIWQFFQNIQTDEKDNGILITQLIDEHNIFRIPMNSTYVMNHF